MTATPPVKMQPVLRETIHGLLSEVHYRKPSGWAIGRLRQVSPSGQLGLEIKATGMLPEAARDDLFDFRGRWEDSEEFGREFHVERAHRVPPSTPEGCARYLIREVKGLGKKTAQKLVDFFGENLRQVLDNDRERLLSCPTVSRKILERAAQGWDNDRILRSIGVYLEGHDINAAWADDLLEEFGDKTVEILETNPYETTRVPKIGFVKAHELALKLGWPERSPQKTEAAARHVLKEATQNGHTYLIDQELAEAVRNTAQVSSSEAFEAIEKVIANGSVTSEKLTKGGQPMRLVYLPWVYRAECGLAQRIGELVAKIPVTVDLLDTKLGLAADKMAQDPSDEQKEAVRRAFSSSVSIITGGPGTGKTQTLRMLVQTAEIAGLKVLLAAPTGRAAKRLAEVTGQNAQTVHRLLEYNGETGRFDRNRENPLETDFVVVDEFSMADTPLANSLLQAIPDGSRVVLIGDVDQLPAVGPGLVLKDLIFSKRLPVTILTRIFRQAEGSLIVQNAHSIRRGEQPIFGRSRSEADCFLLTGPELGIEDWTRERIAKLVQTDIPDRLNIQDPLRDIQVLTPMKKGPIGVLELNEVLQEVLNPSGRPVTVREGKVFRIGDKLMQMKNNYDLNVFNGDQGILEQANTEDETLVVNFYGEKVQFTFKEARHLELSYASTIHKSQGGEWPVVLVCMLKRHFVMLERNLIYTALTRAKRLCLFVGSDVAVRMAVDNCETHKRNTLLGYRVRQQIKEIV